MSGGGGGYVMHCYLMLALHVDMLGKWCLSIGYNVPFPILFMVSLLHVSASLVHRLHGRWLVNAPRTNA